MGALAWRSLDHDDFGLIQSKIVNVIDSKNLERDRQISLRNLRKLDCAGKPAQCSTFPHPALGRMTLRRGNPQPEAADMIDLTRLLIDQASLSDAASFNG